MDKWDKLYNYLNDLALAIAPDERMDEEKKKEAKIKYNTLQAVLGLMADWDEEDDDE